MRIELEHQSMAKLEKMGVKFVKDVDKSGFVKIAEPLQDKTAASLGPHAVEILTLVRRGASSGCAPLAALPP